MGYGNKVTETREYIHEEIVLGNYSRGTALPPERTPTKNLPAAAPASAI